jgi:hypothetical protein
MNTLREDLDAMSRIRQYLQEAQDWAEESGVASGFTGSSTTDSPTPASVTKMIDASAEQTDAVIKDLKERLEASGAG